MCFVKQIFKNWIFHTELQILLKSEPGSSDSSELVSRVENRVTDGGICSVPCHSLTHLMAKVLSHLVCLALASTTTLLCPLPWEQALGKRRPTSVIARASLPKRPRCSSQQHWRRPRAIPDPLTPTSSKCHLPHHHLMWIWRDTGRGAMAKSVSAEEVWLYLVKSFYCTTPWREKAIGSKSLSLIPSPSSRFKANTFTFQHSTLIHFPWIPGRVKI